MKRQKPNKEVLLQEVYEYGTEHTCKRWSITETELMQWINPVTSSAPKIRSTKEKTTEVSKELAEIITRNYEALKAKYVGNKSNLSMCQTSEDIFHSTLLKIMEEVSVMNELQVLDYIDYRFKMIHFQVKQDQKELFKYQIYLEDAYTKESNQTED